MGTPSPGLMLPGVVTAAAVLLTACGGTDDAGFSAADAAAGFGRYCSDCHNPSDLAGDLNLAALDIEHVERDAGAWEAVVRKLRTRTMPPVDAPRPDDDTYAALSGWLESALDANAEIHPGRAVPRRLNRAEYANAIRDVLGLDVDVASLLPPDDAAFGFDNIGDLLTVSPALLERYLAAADRISALAVGDPGTAAGSRTYIVSGDQSQTLHLEGLPLGTVGGIAVEHHFPLDGEYEFDVTLFRNNLELIRGLEHAHRLEIAVDGERVLLEDIGAEHEPDMPGAVVTAKADATDARLRVRVPVGAGTRTVTAAFLRKIGAGTSRLRPFDRSNAGTYDSTGRPHVETLTITGPHVPGGPGQSAIRERILDCEPGSEAAADETACAEEILSRLARAAYRRPVTEADLARILPFYEQGRSGGSFADGIQLGLRRILASPSFVFRIEQDPEGVAPGSMYMVGDFELATRLSFFLWSSLPDERLLKLAAAGRLGDSEVLASEVSRMLADPRATALAENFAGQWLHLRNLETIKPNTDYFPDFDNNLRQAFRQEAEHFFASIVAEDRSIVDLLTADYTYVDERLARHYGLPGVYGSTFRRVELGPQFDARRGLLGKGGVLMATSHADRTAPSLRGKWVLENLLGTPPPPPPPDVPGLDEEAVGTPKTMRERLAMHRESPACAGCHGLIDPLGFALENFDAVGGWRSFERDVPVDASGMLVDGTAVDGVAELRAALLQDPEIFVGTVTEKLMIYALGRGLEPFDMPVVRGILERAAAEDYRFSAVVLGIVESPAFRMRVKSDAASAGSGV